MQLSRVLQLALLAMFVVSMGCINLGCSSDNCGGCDKTCQSDDECKLACSCGCISSGQDPGPKGAACSPPATPCFSCKCIDGQCTSWNDVLPEAVEKNDPSICDLAENQFCRDFCYAQFSEYFIFFDKSGNQQEIIVSEVSIPLDKEEAIQVFVKSHGLHPTCTASSSSSCPDMQKTGDRWLIVTGKMDDTSEEHTTIYEGNRTIRSVRAR